MSSLSVLRALEAVEAIRDAPSAAGAFEAFRRYLEPLGVEHATIAARVNLGEEDETPVWRMVGDWPQEWIARRHARGYVAHDPVVRHLARTRRPFLWSDTYGRATSAGRRILEEAADFGLHDGIAMPLPLIGGPLGGASFAGEGLDIAPVDLGMLEIVTLNAFDRLSFRLERRGPPMPRLTVRETDVLQHAAVGRTNREIAARLGIGEQTVKTHIQTICRKLDASTRAHAVSIGLNNNLIAP